MARTRHDIAMRPILPPVPHRGRFAPSPTGPLHFGSLLAAFGSWLMARQAGGEWIVRIEDIDPPREVPGAADAQLRTLAAFGLHSDATVLRQSTRSRAYQAALDTLVVRGKAFACHCSRSDLAASGGVHRACVAGGGRPTPSIRLRVPEDSLVDFEDAVYGCIEEDVAATAGDVVLRRADDCWAYQLAVVVDDAAQGITDVVRGADLLDSTARQILLQRRLGLPTPRYAHLPLVLDEAGRKLSKSLAALPVDDADPLPTLQAAWRALGQSPAHLPADANLADTLAIAVHAFVPGRIPRSPPSERAAAHNEAITGAA